MKLDIKQPGVGQGLQRAYSRLDVKAVDESDDAVTVRGIATTPTPDRMGDIVDPLGATFAASLPLLWQHRHSEPVGRVEFGKPTKKGIPFTATLPRIREAGRLKDRVDEAIHSLQYRLVGAVSIGFRVLNDAVEILKETGGLVFHEIEIMELSLVTIPANSEATIHSIKSLEGEGLRAAIGKYAGGVVVRSLPGASGQQSTHPPKPKGSEMNLAEVLKAQRAMREQKAAEMDAIMAKAAEDGGRTLDAAEKEAYDTLEGEVEAIDDHLKRLEKHAALAKRVPVDGEGDGEDGADKTKAADTAGKPAGYKPKAGDGVLRPNDALPKGIAFTRYAMALMMSKGVTFQAREIAKQWKDSTPEVFNAIDFAINQLGGSTALNAHMFQQKAAVNVGTSTHGTWAGPLVQYSQMSAEFVELVRNASILGRMQGFRRVPFWVRVPRQTAGVSGYFVGEGAPKPVNALAFDSLTVPPFKAAVIVVITQELARFSSPDAELLVRNDMVKGISEFLDKRFIDPQYVGDATSPASITNTASVTTAAGGSVAQTDAAVEGAFGNFLAANMDPTRAVWVMSPIVALSLSMKRDTQDRRVYPDLTAQGGTWYGLPVITSNSAVLAGSPTEAVIALVDPASILLAQDPGIDIDMSSEASVQMDNAPASGAQSLVSLWQNNLVGFRAEQFVNWVKTRDQAVQVIRYNLSPSAV